MRKKKKITKPMLKRAIKSTVAEKKQIKKEESQALKVFRKIVKQFEERKPH